MFAIRPMYISEHTDDSWEELFNCEDKDRRNYCITFNGRVIDSHLTHEEAKHNLYVYESAYLEDGETP